MSWYTEKIRRLRMDQGLSLQALADKSGITKSYLSQVERGHRKPSFEPESSSSLDCESVSE